VFDHVGFAYEPGRLVLDDVSFTIAAGETVALVGASGAGKTTCANLLLRFWDVERGAITIGGHDLRDLPIAQLRTLVGIVAQQVHLFTGTVADNLRIGAPTRPTTSSRPRPAPPTPTPSSPSCPTATPPRSARTAPACRAASASAWRSPAPCSTGRRC
jgi:ABC-type branched-subunit amino acid transport system ATPase component